MLMGYRSFFVSCLLLSVWGMAECQAQEIELLDGDRVVFVGDGFIEQAQRFGYIEAALTAKWPDRSITFRNVGWSGDTVKGEARDHYTNPPTPYEHLLEQINESDPNVLIMGYGGYLAFENEEAFSSFRADYLNLLEDAGLDNKRCILLSSIPHEQAPSPVPDVSIYNDKLERANSVIMEVAEEKGCTYIDLYDSILFITSILTEDLDSEGKILTSNGVHLTEEGYVMVAQKLQGGLKTDTFLWVDLAQNTVSNGSLMSAKEEGDRTVVTIVPQQIDLFGHRGLSLKGLSKGRYRVSTPAGVLGEMKHSDWAVGKAVSFPGEIKQVGQLRTEIIEKNGLYFRQYRPQNETYLVGFRRYEQGQNAVELDLLNPLIYAKENEIGRLKVPQPITLIIERL